MEIWKDIEGYEGLYQVSNQGRIKSLQYGKERILKLGLNRDGYLHVTLNKDGKVKHYLVHRLVAKAFVPNDDPEHKTEANHINENPSDARACNINWLDHKQNINWGHRNKKAGQKQINHPERSKPVKQLSLDGTLVAIWPSTMEAQRNGFNRANICQCCNGKRKTASGYKWEYA